MTDNAKFPAGASDTLLSMNNGGWWNKCLRYIGPMTDKLGVYPTFAVLVVIVVSAGGSFIKSENMWGLVIVAVAALAGVLIFVARTQGGAKLTPPQKIG